MEETVTISLARYNRLMAENEAASGNFIQVGPYNNGQYSIIKRDALIEKLVDELKEIRKAYNSERGRVFDLEQRIELSKNKHWFK